jgi:mannitol-1-/sugar-/sorbitol-6-phosphatase
MISLEITEGPRRGLISCQAVLLDMDGTLVDSQAAVAGTWRAWAARHGLDGENILRRSHGRQNREVIREVAPHLETPEELAFMVRAEEEWTEGVTAIPGALDLLTTLPPERFAVVTSAWRTLATIRLRQASLPLPSAGAFITSEDVTRSKPHPEGYLLAAAYLGVDPAACVVLEDSPAGIAAGKAAGATVIAVASTFAPADLDAPWCVPDLRSVILRR